MKQEPWRSWLALAAVKNGRVADLTVEI